MASAMSNEDSVIGTNNSSIVSKRSVERMYYPEPHFFRYFVKKPLRRSPLINRGYWLRMHAVHQVVRQFLEAFSPKRKVIVNLGCGYDPLPFQWLSKEPELCRDALFIDVDYPQLVSRKVDIVLANPPLYTLLGPTERRDASEDIILKSPNYLVVGCDLSDTSKLERVLSSCLDFSSSMVLCTAEVAITYMNVDAADTLIHWAAKHEDMQLCLLEQFLPAGPDHPFAKTMIRHFEKLNTPLRSIKSYPRLEDQIKRFEDRGWSVKRAQSLWDFWRDENSVTIEQRRFVESLEPFDEWEEFLLFCSHYFLIVCTNTEDLDNYHCRRHPELDTAGISTQEALGSSASLYELPLSQHASRMPRKRFGTLYGTVTSLAYFGGIAERSRVDATDVYELMGDGHRHDASSHAFSAAILPETVTARACHATASSGDGLYILAGGRASPTKPMKDVWYYNRERWNRVQDLPYPLFRHAMTWVNINDPHPGVLLYGGKSTDNVISKCWLFWRQNTGWQQLSVVGEATKPVFGGVICCTGVGEGLLLGGITEDCVIQSIPMRWRLRVEDQHVVITLSRISCDLCMPTKDISRFGAQIVQTDSNLFLLGGACNEIPSSRSDVLLLEPLDETHGIRADQVISHSPPQGRPLLIGHSALALGSDIVIMGGGATCFSFGTVWNDQALLLRAGSITVVNHLRPVVLEETIEHNVGDQRATAAMQRHIGATKESNDSATESTKFRGNVPRVDTQVNSAWAFAEILQTRSPAVLLGLDFGPCQTTWSLQYLKDRIGHDREVIVHVAAARQMDFLRKSFDYQRRRFATFVDEIMAGSQQYLRSLATEKADSQPANISEDFPSIGDDFRIPPSLHIVSERMHSSILRISGPVNMWLHYDVMANILCQIQGRKRVLLYPPSDVALFSIPPGASSSSVNVFAREAQQLYPSLSSAHAHEVLLGPGEVLFIPPLWLHAVSPEDTVSISANLFFRELGAGYAPGKDVYGNRDVHAYERGRKEIARLVSSFEKLPANMARFYLERLSREMLEKAHGFQ